uniref:Cytochrome c oxidase assembly protein COX20, mitochondrial n=1 Tax=Oncorhynchus mykiss TaxID=8022 RepID=A0A8C7UMW4_ONCMY
MAGEEESDKKGFKVLGILDVQNTPCAREALLHGSGGSLAAGLLHFLATSTFDFPADSLAYINDLFYCRITNAKLRMQQRLIQDGIKNKVMYEGTSLDTVSKPKEQEPCPSCP